MEVKKGYKQTEVGVIPEDWETRPSGELCERIMVGIVIRPSQYYVPYGVPAFRSANIRENKITTTDLVFISAFSNAVLSKSQTRVGDILTVRTGYPGTSAVVGPEHAGSNCIDILISRPSHRVKSDFLSIWINSSFGKEQVLRNQGGLAQKHFNVGDMKQLIVALPTLAEQEAIAGALSDADAWIESLEQLIAKKRQIKQGAMQELLTRQTRLPGFSGEWARKPFGEIAQVRLERVDPRQTGPFEFCVELEHIEQRTGRLLSHTTTTDTSSLKSVFRSGDVLFGKLRAYLRKFWIADRSGVCSTEIWVLAPRAGLLDQHFLLHIVTVDRFIDAASTAYGTHMPRSDWSVVKNYEVPVPPLPEQHAIAAILSDMDAEIESLEAKLTKARQIKQGMMQELLTGRIRLV